jgi:murein DD-endopeptidase MepM/ murein hydrolase activator NlpD
MDNYPTDRRYTVRRSNPRRRHAKPKRQGGLRRLLAFQTLVSIVLFLIIIIAKSIDISAARFVIRQVRYVLDHNVELKSIYTFAQTTVSDIRDSIMLSDGGDKEPESASGTENEVIAVNAPTAGRTDQGGMAVRTDAASDEVPEEEIQSAGLPAETSVLAASSGDIDVYTSDVPGAFGMISPAAGPVVTPFGEIAGPGGIVRMHNGIDISVEDTSDVKAVLDGIVADSGSAPGYGNFIRLSHDNGLTTVYGNCSSITAKINEPIKKGNVIAMVGEDSMTGGSHLHFEVWNGNDPVDPLEYISLTAG